MLVAEGVPNCVCLGPRAQQATEICVGLQVTDGEEHQAAEEYHSLSHPLVVSPPTRTSLQEEDKVSDVISHLRSGSGSAVLIFDESVDELSGHTDDHVIEVAGLGVGYGLKCLPLGTSRP